MEPIGVENYDTDILVADVVNFLDKQLDPKSKGMSLNFFIVRRIIKE